MAKYDKDTKFYWLQLKEDFFEDDTIQWLEEQEPNGKEYCYFYLKLCLKSLSKNGVLIRNVGEILIPYDCKKIAEMTKTDFDTVVIAINLFEKIGLIKILDNGAIYLTQLENLIGSQSRSAFKKQQQRIEREKKLKEIEGGGQMSTFVSTKDRDKDRDKDRNINKFIKPTLEEIKEYCLSRKNSVDAEKFFDFYESKGWKVGKEPMKDWKACVRTWEKNEKQNLQNQKVDIGNTPNWFDKSIEKKQDNLEELEKILEDF